MTGPFTLDTPGIVCAFQSRSCTGMMLGHGGFDVHHEWPLSMGGADNQSSQLALCPNHHRRQHSLIRYLVEDGTDQAVVRHFTSAERTAAQIAINGWFSVGKPPIAGWEAPAAR
jgi:hypothetical protein